MRRTEKYFSSFDFVGGKEKVGGNVEEEIN